MHPVTYCNKARVKRQGNVFGQARESGAARLSFAPIPALAGSLSSAARARVFISPTDLVPPDYVPTTGSRVRVLRASTPT